MTSLAIVVLGIVVLATAIGVAWFAARQRGGTVSAGRLAYFLLPVIVVWVVIAMAAAGLRGIEFALVVGVVLVGVGIAAYLARHWNDARMTAQNRTMLLLLGLAAVGLVLSVISQAVR